MMDITRICSAIGQVFKTKITLVKKIRNDQYQFHSNIGQEIDVNIINQTPTDVTIKVTTYMGEYWMKESE